ncbi:MAG: hypothetical protein QHG99_00105 [Methanomicrobiales archaeon]|nr:hypothetical protein [Methanomicrobiales archaeon]
MKYQKKGYLPPIRLLARNRAIADMQRRISPVMGIPLFVASGAVTMRNAASDLSSAVFNPSVALTRTRYPLEGARAPVSIAYSRSRRSISSGIQVPPPSLLIATP